MKRRTIYKLSVLILGMVMLFGFVGGCGKKEVGDMESEMTETTIEDEESNMKEELVTEVEQEKEVKVPGQAMDFRICIDPGHFENANILSFGDGTSYCEGNITIQIALKLQEILKEKYGIESYLTRDGGHISMGGYTDGGLDSSAISLRGEYANGADLFLSIHTNANLNNANGYGTCSQPIDINKPVILANMVARTDERALRIGNAIGKEIVKADVLAGIVTVNEFAENMDGNALLEWTDAYNDSLGEQGTICVRTSDSGEDYYGVLRGATTVGVPGFIIEHGHHTVPEVRNQILNGDLIEKWAEADAKGIAEGLGLFD